MYSENTYQAGRYAPAFLRALMHLNVREKSRMASVRYPGACETHVCEGSEPTSDLA